MRFGHWGVLAAIAAGLLAPLALAAEEPPRPAIKDDIGPPMQFAVVRDAGPGCEPDCGAWIAADGHIDASTPEAFLGVLREMGQRKLPVFINSGGGSEHHAALIGEAIRARGLSVAVARSVVKGCGGRRKPCDFAKAKAPLKGTPDSVGAFCASACALILAGGTERVAPYWAHIGVHRSLYARPTFRTKYSVTKRVVKGKFTGYRHRLRVVRPKSISGVENAPDHPVYRATRRYYLDMGVRESLMPLLLATPFTSIHWLTRDQMTETRLITREAEATVLLPDWKPKAMARTGKSDTGVSLRGRFTQVGKDRKTVTFDLTIKRAPGAKFVSFTLQTPGATSTGETFAPSADLLLANGGRFPLLPSGGKKGRRPMTAEVPLADVCANGAYDRMTFALVIGGTNALGALAPDRAMGESLTKSFAGACAGRGSGTSQVTTAKARSGSGFSSYPGVEVEASASFRLGGEDVEFSLVTLDKGGQRIVDFEVDGQAVVADVGQYTIKNDPAGAEKPLRFRMSLTAFCSKQFAEKGDIEFELKLPSLGAETLFRDVNVSEVAEFDRLFKAACPGAIAALAERSGVVTASAVADLVVPGAKREKLTLEFRYQKPGNTLSAYVRFKGAGFPLSLRPGKGYLTAPDGRRFVALAGSADEPPKYWAIMFKDQFCASRSQAGTKFKIEFPAADPAGKALETTFDVGRSAAVTRLYHEACRP